MFWEHRMSCLEKSLCIGGQGGILYQCNSELQISHSWIVIYFACVMQNVWIVYNLPLCAIHVIKKLAIYNRRAPGTSRMPSSIIYHSTHASNLITVLCYGYSFPVNEKNQHFGLYHIGPYNSKWNLACASAGGWEGISRYDQVRFKRKALESS